MRSLRPGRDAASDDGAIVCGRTMRSSVRRIGAVRRKVLRRWESKALLRQHVPNAGRHLSDSPVLDNNFANAGAGDNVTDVPYEEVK